MPLLLKMPFSFRALNGVNTCVNMWVFVPLKVCQIFQVCQSVLLRDSHFVSITDLNLESMRRVCVFPSRASLNYVPYFFLCGSNVQLLLSSFPRLLLLVSGLHPSSVLVVRGLGPIPFSAAAIQVRNLKVVLGPFCCSAGILNCFSLDWSRPSNIYSLMIHLGVQWVQCVLLSKVMQLVRAC